MPDIDLLHFPNIGTCVITVSLWAVYITVNQSDPLPLHQLPPNLQPRLLLPDRECEKHLHHQNLDLLYCVRSQFLCGLLSPSMSPQWLRLLKTGAVFITVATKYSALFDSSFSDFYEVYWLLGDALCHISCLVAYFFFCLNTFIETWYISYYFFLHFVGSFRFFYLKDWLVTIC